MENLALKVKISVLWIFMAIATPRCAHWMETGAIDKVLTGEWQVGAGEMFVFTLFWWIPLVMAFMTLTLKDSANRPANMILGIIAIVVNIYHFIVHLYDWITIHSLLIVGSTIVAAILIVWYAYKWPKEA